MGIRWSFSAEHGLSFSVNEFAKKVNGSMGIMMTTDDGHVVSVLSFGDHDDH